MSLDNPFACVTADNGLVAEILPVSPMFIRCGPSSRGRFADRRLARSRRTDARHGRIASLAGSVHRRDISRFDSPSAE